MPGHFPSEVPPHFSRMQIDRYSTHSSLDGRPGVGDGTHLVRMQTFTRPSPSGEQAVVARSTSQKTLVAIMRPCRRAYPFRDAPYDVTYCLSTH